MTPEEYTTRLQELYGLRGSLAQMTIEPAANELLSAIKKRIVEEGRRTDGQGLRDYSTAPFYATKQQFVTGAAFEAVGKVDPFFRSFGLGNLKAAPQRLTAAANAKSKNGKYKNKQRKGMWLPLGYAQLREIQGLPVDITNFYYRGDLIRSYQSQRIAESVVLGITGFVDKNGVSSIVKRRGLEARFGVTFTASAEELNVYLKRVTFSMSRLTVGILQGEGIQPQQSITIFE